MRRASGSDVLFSFLYCLADRPFARWARMMALALTLGLPCHGAAGGPAPDGAAAVSFDIARQPLHDALQAYSRVTERSVLYDTGQVAGRYSAPVRGRMTPDQALAALLAGTGMAARFVAGGAFILVPDGDASSVPPIAAAPDASAYVFFYGRLQSMVARILCADPGLSIGQYRLAIGVRVGGDGTLDEVRVAAADRPSLEARIAARLRGQRVDVAPPPTLRQPVALLVTPRPDARQACAS
ncbi:hypothetical protein GCM10023144_44130 [Pigmentiphaga soli]|uniref:Secretin/TonB short N-terminal domain-containing protein n=2 Tax=Pigmentiphaga soli TaxID=1007095 RepID=A0ABP8HPM0_9BURK